MAQIKEIASMSEIPGGEDYVLVRRGNEDKCEPHTRGVNILVADLTVDSEVNARRFENEIEDAKRLADSKGIKTVFVFVTHPRFS